MLLRASTRFLTLSILLLGTAGEGRAAVVVPPGLSPGDEYRVVFRTSTTIDGTSTDIADYNAFVTGVANSVAELSALGTTWTAIASTATIDARDNTGTDPNVELGVPIYATDGTLIFADNVDMWDGLHLIGIPVNEGNFTESKGPGPSVWTGTAADGTVNSPLGSATPTYGASTAAKTAGARWIDQADQKTNTPSLRLYGISGALTVVPEPGTIVLVLLGLVGYAASGRRFP
jgi:hypothetical protein